MRFSVSATAFSKDCLVVSRWPAASRDEADVYAFLEKTAGASKADAFAATRIQDMLAAKPEIHLRFPLLSLVTDPWGCVQDPIMEPRQKCRHRPRRRSR